MFLPGLSLGTCRCIGLVCHLYPGMATGVRWAGLGFGTHSHNIFAILKVDPKYNYLLYYTCVAMQIRLPQYMPQHGQKCSHLTPESCEFCLSGGAYLTVLTGVS